MESRQTRQAVLDALAEGPVSGPELASRLDVSRAAVWKTVDSLRDAGFTIDGTPAGYVMREPPAYGQSAIRYGLEAPFTIDYHDEVDSTNRRARNLAAGDHSDVAVVADRQTGGRGRLDRDWSSPSGGIWMSLLQRPDIPPAHAPAHTLAAAVATTQTCREAGVDAHIKWPNDVLVGGQTTQNDTEAVSDGAHPPAESAETTRRGGHKLAGILTEMEGEADRISWLVVGIGVNLNVDAAGLPSTATSLQTETGTVDRRQFLQRLLERFADLRADLTAVLPAWREHASTLGTRVRVHLNTPTPTATETNRDDPESSADNRVVEGRAVDVEFPGTLVIDTGSGLQRVHAGDCEHLRSDA